MSETPHILHFHDLPLAKKRRNSRLAKSSIAAAAAQRLIARISQGCFQNYTNYELWRRVHRRVVYAIGAYGCVHPGSHESLGLGIDHAILFGDQIPRGR